MARKLRQSNNVIIADYVDGPHESRLDQVIDGTICSSFTEFSWLRERHHPGEIALVPHAADDRLLTLRSEDLDRHAFACGYFGLERNGLFVRELESLNLLYVSETPAVPWHESLSLSPWANRLRDFPVQYIARPSSEISRGRFKPFNKGFQAAQLNQLVIGARFDSENRYWLGDDYPFYLETESLGEAIRAIKQAEQAWGQRSGEIQMAMETMARLRRISCPIQNALDYRDALVNVSR